MRIIQQNQMRLFHTEINKSYIEINKHTDKRKKNRITVAVFVVGD
jgi:hypothetical protein